MLSAHKGIWGYLAELSGEKAKLFVTPACVLADRGSALPRRELEEPKCHGLQHTSDRIPEIGLPRSAGESVLREHGVHHEVIEHDLTLSLGPAR